MLTYASFSFGLLELCNAEDLNDTDFFHRQSLSKSDNDNAAPGYLAWQGY